jgi:hypothetical protein
VIDPKTGSLSFEDPVIKIGPTLTRSEFLCAAWSSDAADLVVNEPRHSWWFERAFYSESIPFSVCLYFHDERLKMVIFSDSDPKFGRSWDDYSFAKEMDRNASHEKWLSACIGSQRAFPWGSVWSGYDQRGGSSFICIEYEVA